ncbi:MAG TPA: tetratricopeptide repeat protein [Terriglobales bacterium]|nr:tetratricopeptide repeat protein [Terriglobales bacterium]
MPDHTQQAEDHYFAALDLFAEGKHEEAIGEYRKCLELDPEHADAMHGLARAYQDLNRLDDSIAISKRLVELDPDDILAHTSLSIAYQKKGMIPEAEAEANQARILGWKQQLKKK